MLVQGIISVHRSQLDSVTTAYQMLLLACNSLLRLSLDRHDLFSCQVLLSLWMLQWQSGDVAVLACSDLLAMLTRVFSFNFIVTALENTRLHFDALDYDTLPPVPWDFEAVRAALAAGRMSQRDVIEHICVRGAHSFLCTHCCCCHLCVACWRRGWPSSSARRCRGPGTLHPAATPASHCSTSRHSCRHVTAPSSPGRRHSRSTAEVAPSTSRAAAPCSATPSVACAGRWWPCVSSGR
jgi:hypothetical protein